MLKALRNFFIDPVFVKKKAFLKSLPLFGDLNGRELGHLIGALHSRFYHEGEPLFSEGDIGRSLFIIESGKVELAKKDPSGKPRQIAVLGPGDFFGEMALLEHLPRSASAVALEKSHVHLLYRTRLDPLMHYRPAIGISIMRHLAELLSSRLRKATQAISAENPSVGV